MGGYPLQKGEPMRARLCSHTKSDATPCRAVALAGYSLCFAHQRQQRRQQARRTPAIRLGSLSDPHSIQRALSRVFQATVSSSIPPVRTTAFLESIRIASQSQARQQHRAPMELLLSLGFHLPAFALTPARLYNQPNPAHESIPRSREPERKI